MVMMLSCRSRQLSSQPTSISTLTPPYSTSVDCGAVAKLELIPESLLLRKSVAPVDWRYA